MRLQDKVVVITGSGSGLGREAALLFAAEGATVVTSDRVVGRAQAVAKEIEAMGGNSAAFDADVREEAAVETLVSQAVDAFGRIDVMWANAGIPEPGFGARQFVDSRLEDWNDIFSVNVTGIYLAWKHAAKWMLTTGRPGTLDHPAGSHHRAGKCGVGSDLRPRQFTVCWKIRVVCRRECQRFPQHHARRWFDLFANLLRNAYGRISH